MALLALVDNYLTFGHQRRECSSLLRRSAQTTSAALTSTYRSEPPQATETPDSGVCHSEEITTPTAPDSQTNKTVPCLSYDQVCPDSKMHSKLKQLTIMKVPPIEHQATVMVMATYKLAVIALPAQSGNNKLSTVDSYIMTVMKLCLSPSNYV